MEVTRRWLLAGLLLIFCAYPKAHGAAMQDEAPLSLPNPGDNQMRVISPVMLELTRVTAQKPVPARPNAWDFVDDQGRCQLPAPAEFKVSAGGQSFEVTSVGFRRRVLYAPLKQWDLRLVSSVYLRLARPIGENAMVEVTDPDGKLWPASMKFAAACKPDRWSPVIHVNQTGYLANGPKQAMVGYYLGSLGELDLGQARSGEALSTNAPAFSLQDAASGQSVFSGILKPRSDSGFPFDCYQKVFEADFSDFKKPGEYRLAIASLGVSYPFFIGDEVAGAFARSYALGIYHQRCGQANALPFTRFVHSPCHTAPAAVPDMSQKFSSVNESLAKESANFKDNPRHTAPQLKNVAASLYPFVNHGPVDVSGGHHDAGDYSKYTINSASFIHELVFAADVFPGVKELDNLGLPESGDGKSDILQEAKWEADFLSKMQDADGGFYFLVYPLEREYEIDVLPDHGDPQVVFPKTTSATAAATAALAQCASSPTFKKQFPAAAASYLAKAKKGWEFLERAVAKYGKDGAYQKITHYGDEFMHDDELAWAACELYLATGEDKYQQKTIEWLKPNDPAMRKWGWWRLFDAYGNAVRSYAFAAKAGKVRRDQLDRELLEQCEDEIAATGEDQLKRAEESAYGTSFPEETKRVRTAGWYFSSDAAFDLAVACQLDYPEKRDPRPQMREAILSNLNYEEGCNPVNVTYLTGLGWRRQREIVDQYAQNDRRVLPPTGIPLGNIQAGLGWLFTYRDEPEKYSFPPDGADTAPYPFYDRWSDAFNLSQEFVILNQARALGYLAWLMAQTPLKSQPWRAAKGVIRETLSKSGTPGAGDLELSSPDLDLSNARVVWEAEGQDPVFGAKFRPQKAAPAWVEAEAQLSDGRRVFAVKNSNTAAAR